MTNETKNPCVVAMNEIIAEWKQCCAWCMSKKFQDAKLDPEKLAKQSWTDIVGVVYKLLSDARMNAKGQNPKKLTYDEQVECAYDANHTVLESVVIVDNGQGFRRDKEVYQFYRDNFGAASNYAQQLLGDGKYLLDRDWSILPNGTEYNNGLPASFQHITPRVMEMNAVIKNPDVHGVDDVLLYKNGGIVVIKAVPQLSGEALTWATLHKMKVYGG